MYNELFSVGPFTVYSYGLCIAIGILACIILASKRAKKVGLSEDICYGLLFSGAITGFIGAKIFYVIVEWESFIKNPISFISSSGFVVYGGITFGILAGYLYCLFKKTEFIQYLDLAVASIALAQGFGRIGCFMAGCCYGRPTDSFLGVVFHNSAYAPNNIKLLPTQLFSAAGDFLICGILLLLDKKIKRKGTPTGLYIVLYSIGRFGIEYLRNDPRGSVGRFSTSQFYGLFACLLGLLIMAISYKLNRERPSAAVAEVKVEATETKVAETVTEAEETIAVTETEAATETDTEA